MPPSSDIRRIYENAKSRQLKTGTDIQTSRDDSGGGWK